MKYYTDLKKYIGNKYDYSLVQYKNIHDKVDIICPIHGVFSQSANSHCKGVNCPECSSDKKTYNLEFFLEKLPQDIKDTYDLSLVNYINNITKIKVICKSHGIFQTIPRTLMRGHGCPKCARIKVGANNRLTYDEIVQKATYVHNNKFKYFPIDDYKSNKDLWSIECPIHGVFKQSVVSHLRGNGCNQCAKEIFCSKQEKSLAHFVESLGYRVIRNYRPVWMNNLELDIYLPEDKVAIEYNGLVYHHSSCNTSVEFYNNSAKSEYFHKNKYDLCKQNNVNLIHVFDFENIDSWKQSIKLYLENKNRYKIMYNHIVRSYSPRKDIELIVYGKTEIIDLN